VKQEQMAAIVEQADVKPSALAVETELGSTTPMSTTPKSGVSSPAIIPLRKPCPKRFEGTYRATAKIDWLCLLNHNFKNSEWEPDWEALYPINSKGSPVGLLSPRLACKLFWDGIFILGKTDENAKYMQDRIPECTHKFFKKKQWRKQFIEGCRRVVCRLAKGLGFSANCQAEEVFVHVVLRDAFTLGWRRIDAHIEHLPETDRDRDYARVLRLGAHDETGLLFKEGALDPAKAKSIDLKNWFRAYAADDSHMSDHILTVEEQEAADAAAAAAEAAIEALGV